MTRFGLMFLLFAALTAMFGFGLVPGPVFATAKVVFVVFLVLAVVAFIMDSRRWHPMD